MAPLLVALAAVLVSIATFFTGFGLGTLLMPVLALWMPLEQAIAATAAAHLLNNLAKALLVGRHADRRVLLCFGLPAVLAAFAGAALLAALGTLPPVFTASWTGRDVAVTPLSLAAAVLIAFFAAAELIPAWRDWAVPPRFMPLGGILSGFFGGLSGHQGAFRAAFLLRAGLSKEAFVGTGVIIACAVDLARLLIYLALGVGALRGMHAPQPWRWDLLAAAGAGAVAGSLLAARTLTKVTLTGIRAAAAALMLLIAAALASGAL